jgi:hypothetical protein
METPMGIYLSLTLATEELARSPPPLEASPLSLELGIMIILEMADRFI